MFGWALFFIVVAIVAGVLGSADAASIAAEASIASYMAWLLFAAGLILAAVFFVVGRRPPL